MGFRHRGATQRRCQQPCFADSRQRAERRPADRGRIGSDSGFAVGCAAGRSSRGLHWRCARCGPVVRFFPRALLHEVAKDGADGGRFLDAGDDPHGATAVDAGGDVDGKDPLEVCAQLIERRFSSGLRGASFALASAGSTAASCRLPRPEGVNCARRAAFGANTPWKRVRWARGGGTSAASLAMKSTGSHSTCVVPLRHGVLSW